MNISITLLASDFTVDFSPLFGYGKNREDVLAVLEGRVRDGSEDMETLSDDFNVIFNQLWVVAQQFLEYFDIPLFFHELFSFVSNESFCFAEMMGSYWYTIQSEISWGNCDSVVGFVRHFYEILMLRSFTYNLGFGKDHLLVSFDYVVVMVKLALTLLDFDNFMRVKFNLKDRFFSRYSFDDMLDVITLLSNSDLCIPVFCPSCDIDDLLVLYSIEPSMWLSFNWNDVSGELYDDGSMARLKRISEWNSIVASYCLSGSNLDVVSLVTLESEILFYPGRFMLRKFIFLWRRSSLKDLFHVGTSGFSGIPCVTHYV
jgi:hypothetical protein